MGYSEVPGWYLASKFYLGARFDDVIQLNLSMERFAKIWQIMKIIVKGECFLEFVLVSMLIDCSTIGTWNDKSDRNAFRRQFVSLLP